MAGESNRLFIVLDTESTGLDRRPKNLAGQPRSADLRGSEVCQIGGLVLSDHMNPIRLFCYYCDIVAPFSSPQAYTTHGIDHRRVRDYLYGEYLPEVMTKYLPEFFAEDVIFIGYNTDFDMEMIDQTLENSPGSFTWRPCKGPIIPKHGRFSVDVAEFMKANGRYRKLSSFERELLPKRELAIREWQGQINVDTNCIEMLQGTWAKAHNSFFDALNTYLLWRDDIWKKKLY